MSMSDPIADFLTRLRNGVAAEHRFVDVDWNKMNQFIAQILQDTGFIDHFISKKEGSRGTMRIFLKYGPKRQPVMQSLKRMSKPGMRQYIGHEEIRRIRGGMGISILSTSQGVLAGEEARKRKVGGELLCEIW